MEAKKLLEKYHVDQKTGFLFRYICSETERFVLHCHDFYEIFLTLDGTIGHKVNGQIQQLEEGSLVFIRPEDTHCYIYNKVDNYRFLNLTFSQKTAQDLFDYFGDGFDKTALLSAEVPPIVVLSKDEKDRMYKKFLQINTILQDNYSKTKFMMRAYLAEIISTYFADYINEKQSTIPYWLEKLCSDMNQKNNFQEGISRMVYLSGKTKEHLSRSMKKYYGVTPSEFINHIRMNFAANLLKNSNMDVLDICYECGFQNVSWFYEKFKEEYHYSPKKYRVIDKQL